MVGLGGEEDLTLRILHPLPNLQRGALVEGLTSHCNWNAALPVLEGSGWVQRMLKAYLSLFTPGLRATPLFSPKSLKIFGCSLLSSATAAIPLFKASGATLPFGEAREHEARL